MSGYPTVNFSDSEKGLFTPAEIQHLMRIEYERAVRYEYPLTLMLIEVDRLGYLQDLYGFESKEEILQGVISLLRSITRQSDVLGCMLDDRLMSVFPHTPGAAASSVAGRLLRGCRTLDFQSDGRRIRITLSIGIAVTRRGEEPDFERFLTTAEEALSIAVESGGDRFVEREPLPDPIADLKARIGEVVAKAPPPPPAPPVAVVVPAPAPAAAPSPLLPDPEDLGGEGLTDKLRALFDALGPPDPTRRALEDHIIGAAQKSLDLAREQALSGREEAHKREIERLEARIEKLRTLLDSTEEELQRQLEAKTLDPGIASVYREVAGLSPNAKSYEKKKEVLGLIYEANVRLLEELKGSS